MKTITVKEFRRSQSAILKEVAAGQTYQLTFHTKPVAVVSPAVRVATKKIIKGSRAAFLESLKHTVKSTGDIQNLSHKELKTKMMNDKYGPI